MKSALEYPLNTRVYLDVNSKTDRVSPFEILLAVATLTLYVGWLHILLLLFVLSFYSTWALCVLLALFSTLALPAKPVYWRVFLKLGIFTSWRRYFAFSFLAEERLQPGCSYILAEFPHGAVPLSPLIAGTICPQLYPEAEIYSLAASSVFYIPFWRHFIAWIGALPATKTNFRKLLQKGCVAVILGGIAEMYMQDPRRERILLKSRTGFIKIAMEQGTPIVPVYHFGNTQILDFFPQSWSNFARKTRMSFGFLYGAFGLPVPRRRPLFMVSGKMIAIEKTPLDDPEYSTKLKINHERVMNSLQEMYDRHKGQYGWANRPLSIE